VHRDSKRLRPQHGVATLASHASAKSRSGFEPEHHAAIGTPGSSTQQQVFAWGEWVGHGRPLSITTGVACGFFLIPRQSFRERAEQPADPETAKHHIIELLIPSSRIRTGER
jgi:hypothetical protein